MTIVSFGSADLTLSPDETILEGLEKAGHLIPSSCRSGVCQSCLMQVVKGSVPASSQKGLKSTLAAQGYFLSCICKPDADVTVALADSVVPCYQVRILEKQNLGEDVFALRLSVPEALQCSAGQYVHLVHGALIRSYSVASLPLLDGYVELHIRRMPGGKLSNWLYEQCETGTSLELRGALGSCFYVADSEQQFPIILAGTSTGLAPLEGIARDALKQGHTGPIVLIHGARNRAGLYHTQELQELMGQYPNFTYQQAVMEDGESGDIMALTKAQLANLGAKQARVFLCGAPELVNTLKRQVFLQGVGSGHIHSDPFVTAAPVVAAKL